MQQHNTPSTDSGFPGGLIAALVAFALTWFVVNGGEAREAHGAELGTGSYSVCDVPKDIPTSRFFNAPVATPVPLQGG
ncbi:MAG: hypothetical protein IT492_03145 [Gammaproteobacteria bacterium]|nr:hypothetical protein [Gammaproteobacteria bacterium]